MPLSVSEQLIPTRATLIARLRDWRDQSSWQEFFDTYWKLIYGIALKGGLTDAEAQDVVQETMIGVAQRMPAFKYDPAIGSFKAWLLNLTRWRIADQFRNRGRHTAEPDPHAAKSGPEAIDPISDSLSRAWEAEWEKTLLDAAIARVKRRLDPQKFQVFDFYVNKGWPPEKVARTFDLSVDQVYLSKHRITQLIQEEVRRLEKEMI